MRKKWQGAILYCERNDWIHAQMVSAMDTGLAGKVVSNHVANSVNFSCNGWSTQLSNHWTYVGAICLECRTLLGNIGNIFYLKWFWDREPGRCRNQGCHWISLDDFLKKHVSNWNQPPVILSLMIWNIFHSTNVHTRPECWRSSRNMHWLHPLG